MSTGRYLLTGAVLLGGAVYYDQNVQPIFPDWVRQKEAEIPHKVHQEQQRFSLDISSKYNKDVKPRIEKFGNQVSSKASSLKDDVVDSAKSVQDKFKLTKVYKETDDYLKKVDSEARRLAEKDEEKSFARQAVISYIDWVNEVAGAAATEATRPEEFDVVIVEYEPQSWSLYLYDKSGLHYVSDKVSLLFHEGKNDLDAKENQLNAKAKEFGNKAEDAKNRVVDEANAKYNEAASKYGELKKSASELYADAKKAASDLYEDAKKTVNQQWDKASAAAEAQKQKAIDDYYKSRKDLDDIVAKGDAAKARDVESAKQKLNLAYLSLRLFGDNVVKDANDKLDKLK